MIILLLFRPLNLDFFALILYTINERKDVPIRGARLDFRSITARGRPQPEEALTFGRKQSDHDFSAGGHAPDV